ncbi:uncharacterized protein [Lolium perenne]|uniref:uncharacterized protein n=1 Tax=Lolium perenne TaxID=4522 RepID=UPI003A996A10
MAGTHNYINVLQRSPVFVARLAEGHALPVNFEINCHAYNKRYYLADGIYLEYATFVKTIFRSCSDNEPYFAACQETCRKDVERAFDMLKQHFAIVRYHFFTWSESQIWEVMNARVIMHNIIIESERNVPTDRDQSFDFQGPLTHVEHVPAEFAAVL